MAARNVPLTDVDPLLREHLERVCRAAGLELDNLPEGYEHQDLLEAWPLPPEMRELIEARQRDQEEIEQAAGRAPGAAPMPGPGSTVAPDADRGAAASRGDGDATAALPEVFDVGDRIAAGEKRPVGRPRHSHPAVDWAAIEHLLVFGETYEWQGQTLVRYPTPGDLAKRFNVSRAGIQKFATDNDLAARRGHVQKRVQEEVTEAVVAQNAGAIVKGRSKVISICDALIDQFETAVKQGKIRFDSPSDLDKIVRLREFAAGNADRRSEQTVNFTLQDIQERHREQQRRRAEAAGLLEGDVVGRTAREIPSMGVVDERIVEQPGGGYLIMPAEDETADALATDEPTRRAAPARTGAPDADDRDDGVLRIAAGDDQDDGDAAAPDAPAALAIHEGDIPTRPVASQNIAEMGYDAQRRVMEVYFHTGAVYRYAGVSQQLFDDVFHAGSPGRAFALHVKPHFQGVRIDGGR